MLSSAAMKLFTLLTFNSLALAASSTSMVMTGSMSTMSMSSSASAAATTSTDTSPPYSITALPAVVSAPSCIFNCLIPIGLADPSGCDDVTENCACISAPSEVLDFLTDCVNTVCKSSTSAFGASATSLYVSYCDSVYGTATFSEAFVEESSAAAASSSAAAASAASEASVSSAEAHSTASVKASSTPSASSTTTKSDGGRWEPALLFGTLALGGLIVLIAL